ncbi:MAG: inorganic phosphate transporter [Deltaproteobacteria bacterium]|nr:MAG: inorganic phosphate transporter [Deltaproteobacteria bacterium]
MDLNTLRKIEDAAGWSRKELFRLGSVLLFIVGVMLFTATPAINATGDVLLIVAALIGAYMALNIGANDVANNVGPAVGSKALTLTGAILIAVVLESAGALVAGGDVVETVRKGIIDPALIADSDTFVWMMMGALLAAALWLNAATLAGAPVSTTHSIVGGVLGAGIAAAGWEIADWPKVGQIMASWVISPVLGGLIAAGFLYLIKRSITYQENMMAAARRVVPFLVAVMAWAFGTYLMLKGVKKIVNVGFPIALLVGLGLAVLTFVVVKVRIRKTSKDLTNDKAGVNQLFTIPLIGSAALLSFAHGANDVANAVGPLAGIYDTLSNEGISPEAGIPLWIMVIGAAGIALGLALYGPKLIRKVGSEITELDQMRAYSIAMAAALTVIVASQLGLPVSSTHIAVGGVFGVGFLREFIKRSYGGIVEEVRQHHHGEDEQVVEAYLERFGSAPLHEKKEMLDQLKASRPIDLTKKDRKRLKKAYRTELVKRQELLKIASAWVITLPASALMSALIYYTLRGMMLP